MAEMYSTRQINVLFEQTGILYLYLYYFIILITLDLGTSLNCTIVINMHKSIVSIDL